MKDWQARLFELDRRLGEYERAVAAEVRRLAKERKLRGLFKRPSSADLELLTREARAKIGGDPMPEISAFFEELTRYYITCEGAEAPVRERGLIRARIGQAEELFGAFWSYARAAPSLIRGTNDEARVEMALAALAIHDGRVDIELLRETMGKVYAAALIAGIDPKPSIEKIAAIANKGMAGGGVHMRSFLLEFDRSPYFRDRVQPFLPGSRHGPGERNRFASIK
jgi:hypothetical protein